jgi:hypothetical protein
MRCGMIDEKLYKEKKKFGKGFIYLLHNGCWVGETTLRKFQEFLTKGKEETNVKETRSDAITKEIAQWPTCPRCNGEGYVMGDMGKGNCMTCETLGKISPSHHKRILKEE